MATSNLKLLGLRRLATLTRRFQLPALHSKCYSIQTNQKSIQEKYAEKIQQKLKEQGLRDLEELKKINRHHIEAERAERRKAYEELINQARKKLDRRQALPSDHSSPETQEKRATRLASTAKKYSSPIKPLDSIINLSKVASESANEITKLWTAYHLSTSNPPRLGAVIPTETYRSMLGLAKQFPSFVIPLAKSEQSNTTDTPFEIQYLQWDFVSPPCEPELPEFLREKPKLVKSTVAPTIVMYTPLAEYKLRQSFAQPTLILTHYTDLAESHGIVLMRGDLTPSSNGNPEGRLALTEAQVLVLRLQQFYCSSAFPEPLNPIHERRRSLLRRFHQEPSRFQWAELLDLVKDVI